MSKPIKCPCCKSPLTVDQIKSILGAYTASLRKVRKGGRHLKTCECGKCKTGSPNTMDSMCSDSGSAISPALIALTEIRQHNNAVYEVGPNEERKLVPFEEIA